MIQVIQSPSDLPREGVAHEMARLEFKLQVDPEELKRPTELAKDVAAFANSVGGTILIGAIRDGERLAMYRPLGKGESSSAMKAFDRAVRDLCSPAPLVEMFEIERGDGLVLAVNVWAFPGQPVGVAFDQPTVSSSTAFRFPYRAGAQTKYLQPGQLPMMMLPDVRRIAILLSQIPLADRGSVTLEGMAQNVNGQIPFRKEVCLALDLEDVALRNTVRFTVLSSDQQFTIPVDSIKHVWRSSANRWIISTRLTIRTEGREAVVTPWA